MTSKDSDKPVHPPSMARVLIYPSLDSPEQRLIRLHKWAGWSLLVTQVLGCRFCRVLAPIKVYLHPWFKG